MGELLLVLMVSVLGIGLAVGIGRTYTRRRDEAWKELARRRNGRFERPETWFFGMRGAPMVDVVEDDVALHLDTYTVSHGKSSTTYTRIRAQYLLPVGPTFRVYREHFFATLGKALGFEDVTLGGHPRFDEEFIVKTDHAEATGEALNDRIRDLLCGPWSKATLASDGRTITLTAVGVITDVPQLERGLVLVKEVAHYGQNLLEALRTLPGARWSPPVGPWDERSAPGVKVEERGRRVALFPMVVRHGVALCASTPVQRELPPFAIWLDRHGRPDEPFPKGVLDGELAGQLSALGPAILRHDGITVRIVVLGEPDRDRLILAVRFVAEVAMGSIAQGAFR